MGIATAEYEADLAEQIRVPLDLVKLCEMSGQYVLALCIGVLKETGIYFDTFCASDQSPYCNDTGMGMEWDFDGV